MENILDFVCYAAVVEDTDDACALVEFWNVVKTLEDNEDFDGVLGLGRVKEGSDSFMYQWA